MVATPPPVSSRDADHTLGYVLHGPRHDGRPGPRNWFIASGGCLPDTAAMEWKATRQKFGKDGTRHVVDEDGDRIEGRYVQAYHLVLSDYMSDDAAKSFRGDKPRWFEFNEKVAIELAEGDGGGWQWVLATQDDGRGGKDHAHTIFNSVHPITGLSMSGRHPVKDVQQLRSVVDRILLDEYGIDNAALHKERQGELHLSKAEERRKDAGQPVAKMTVDERLSAALAAATDRESFKEQAAIRGVEVRYRGKGVSYGLTDEDGTTHNLRGRAMGTRWNAARVDEVLAENALQAEARHAARGVAVEHAEAAGMVVRSRSVAEPERLIAEAPDNRRPRFEPVDTVRRSRAVELFARLARAARLRREQERQRLVALLNPAPNLDRPTASPPADLVVAGRPTGQAVAPGVTAADPSDHRAQLRAAVAAALITRSQQRQKGDRQLGD